NGESVHVVALKVQAQKAIEGGELDRANALLEEASGQQLAAIEWDRSRATESLAAKADAAAEITAQRGEIALAQLRYMEAAKQFGNAGALVPASSAYDDKRIGYLRKEAAAFFKQGYEFGDNDALLTAIERYGRLVKMMSRDRAPAQWAAIQNDFGNALLRLGERESDIARLEAAASA